MQRTTQQQSRKIHQFVLLVLVLGILSSCKLRVSSERAVILKSAVLAQALWKRGGGEGEDGDGAEEEDSPVLQLQQQGHPIEAALDGEDEAAASASPNATDDRSDIDDNSSDIHDNYRAGDEPAKGSRKSLRKLEFLDRIALIASALRQESAEIRDRSAGKDASSYVQAGEERGPASSDITPQSDLSRPGRHIHVVTTAALPWFTGTAVNPLLRAAYLHRTTQQINSKPGGTEVDEDEHGPTERWVTLVVPWLELPEDQQELYGRVFASEAEQEAYIREWLATQGSMPDAAQGLKFSWYPARYHSELRSIFAMGDIMSLLEEDELDVCVLGTFVVACRVLVPRCCLSLTRAICDLQRNPST
jgi:hypothetical protein